MQYTPVVEHFDNENEPLEEDYEDEHQNKQVQFSGTLVTPFQMSRRPCQDALFLILFIVFIIGLFLLGFSAIQRGNPTKLIRPTDYLGRTCGSQYNTISTLPSDKDCKEDVNSQACQDKVRKANEQYSNEDLSTRTYLWYMDISKPIQYGGVCVSYCPGRQPNSEIDQDGQLMEGDVITESIEKPSTQSFCPPQLLPSSNGSLICTTKRIDDLETYPSPLVQQAYRYMNLEYRTLLHRCIPTTTRTKSNITADSSLMGSTIFDKLNTIEEMATEMWGDVLKNWKVILISVVVFSLVSSVIFLFVIRHLAHVFVWTSVFLTIAGITVMGAVGLLEGFEINYPKAGLGRLLNKNYISKQVYVTFGTILFIVDALFVLLILLNVKRISRSVGILREAAAAVSCVPQLFLLPFLMFSGFACFVIYWFVASLYMWSSGGVRISDMTSVMDWDLSYRLVFAYHLFGYFWFVEFWNGILKVCVASAIAEYYWTPEKSQKNKLYLTFPVCRAFGRLIVYHLGSVAFASFVLGSAEFISFLLRHAVRRLEKLSNDNWIVRCFGWLIRIIISLFNAIVRWITRHAYIQIAIYGDNFWNSSRSAANLISRNADQMAVVDWIGDLVILFAKCCISCITSFAAYCMTKQSSLMSFDGTVSTPTPILVVVIVFITSYHVSSLFLNVYSTAIDTIHHSYLIDQELSLNSNNVDYQVRCSESLQKLMQENKQENVREGY
ncbi:choline transporter-like protein [Acrasis kona]|uniref:Choline transporter-like protein n=1 Tax=Acrasis kona TaxID=1008807 RepID=A0AAW2YNT2_9EUKA